MNADPHPTYTTSEARAGWALGFLSGDVLRIGMGSRMTPHPSDDDLWCAWSLWMWDVFGDATGWSLFVHL